MNTRFKMVRPEIKSVDVENGTVTAIVSTESPDRDGDIVRASGWNLEHFNKHPVLLSSHNYGSLTSQIGEWTGMEVKGKKLQGTAKYYTASGNAEADWGFELAKRGRAAFSVGFVPDMDLAKPIGEGKNMMGPLEFKGQELLEVSHVTVPANAEALQRMKGLSIDPIVEQIIGEMTIKGDSLAGRLNTLIDARVTDDRSRGDVIDSMASAASISASTVNQILSGAIDCPPRDRLAGFAEALGTSTANLIRAAERDGCSYGEEEGVFSEEIATKVIRRLAPQLDDITDMLSGLSYEPPQPKRLLFDDIETKVNRKMRSR